MAQAEEDQRLAERERRLASGEEELKMQKAGTMGMMGFFHGWGEETTPSLLSLLSLLIPQMTHREV